MNGKPDPLQTMQRVKVGVIGLFAVVLLIALASAIIKSAVHDRAGDMIGQGNSVAAEAALNDHPAAGEPLAEMGVAPSAGNLQESTSAIP